MQPWDDKELEAIRTQHAGFAAEHLADDPLAHDRDGEFSRDRWRECARLGALGTCVDPAYGGQGKPVTHAVAALEGLGYGCPDGGFVYALVSQLFGIQMPLQLMASDAIREKYLPPLVGGDLIAAHAFTEISAGSDAYAMDTTAVRENGMFRLTGTKTFITNAPEADVGIVFAKTGAGRSPFDLTAFFVDFSWHGVSKGTKFEKLGLRTVPMGQLAFDGVEVPDDHVIGRSGGGLAVLAESTGWERSVLLTAALGPMRRTVDECVERAKTREQFERPIGSFQQVSAKIADMISRYRLSRLVIYDMASRLGTGKSTQRMLQDAAIAKLFVSENYVQLHLDALQLFGVRGYLMDSLVQQRLRDSLSSTIYAGTSEIMRNMIARMAGLPVE